MNAIACKFRVFLIYYLCIYLNRQQVLMIRINVDTPIEILQAIKVGDMVTDGFSKTSLVESIAISDDAFYRIYEFHLITGRVITTKR